jgi:N-acetylglucosaminyldiphosphoundecaprenol N-acetyl-beta-D-mannosaminyltransferase
MREVEIGNIGVVDADMDRVRELLADRYRAGEKSTALALHVGGLLERKDPALVQAYRDATVTYADGMSIVLLGRLAGGSGVGRVPTTDLGHELIRDIRALKDGPVTVGLVGGPPGLAARAASALEARHDVRVEYVADGYAEAAVAAKELADPARNLDIVFVGMGCPAEMIWVDANPDLAARLVVTCGGWFGFVAGDEARAPQLLQRAGLEWTWRFAQSPRTKGKRYIRGMGVVAAVGGTMLAERLRPAVRRLRRR